jgi:hypothetical protein
MDYLLGTLAFIATVLAIRGQTWDAKQSGFRKITLTGSLTILLAFAVLCVSLIKTYKDKNKFHMSDVHITFYAENLESHQPDNIILANAPEAFTVDSAYLDSYATRFDFSSIRDVARPTGYRAPNRATLIYHSINLRRNFLESDKEPPFENLADLNGKKLFFRVPVYKFNPIPKSSNQEEKVNWRFRAELIVGGKIFEQQVDENGKIEFIIDGI